MARKLIFLLLSIFATASFAQGNMWSDATPVSPLAGTYRIPIATSSSSGPSYVTPPTIKSYIETGGVVTSSDPVLDLSQTWNAGAVAFTAVNLDVTATASAASSKLFSVKSSGTPRVEFIENTGTANDRRLCLFSSGLCVIDYGTRYLSSSSSNTYRQWLFHPGTGFAVSSVDYIGFSNQQFNAHGGSWDVRLYRDADGVLAQRNTTSAQTLRVYNTYTDSSNYERLALNAGATGDWLQVAAETAGTGVDNIGLAFSPAGTGPISAHVPDSTATRGNARGANAVDWQTSRSAAAQVASGAGSTIVGGTSNTASGLNAVAGGDSNTASANYGVVFGTANTASGTAAFAAGSGNTASGSYSWSPGGYQATTRGLSGVYAYSAGQRSALGDAQVIGQPVRRTTTDATPVSLATDGTPAATTVMVLPASSMMACEALVGMKYGSDSAGYKLYGVFERDGSNNTSLVGSVNQIVIAEDAGLSGADATLVANDTLEAAEIQVTGPAGTAYSVGELKCVQVL